ncbi:hypothetical protein SAMN02910358_00244 [Lachnospiraceae bacterium XBB1006]|nr:hypothetical protein SAMN02910358_00244 [Lachnospiraceae bacterium XBB1006]
MDKKIVYTGRQNNPDGAPNRILSYVICFFVVVITILATILLWIWHMLTARFYLMTTAINLITLGFMIYTRYFSGEASDYEAYDVTTSWNITQSKLIIEEFFGPQGRLTSYRFGDVVISDKENRHVRYQFERTWIHRIIWDYEIHAIILAWNDHPESAADAYALFFVNEEVESELINALSSIQKVEKDCRGDFLK